MRWAIRLGLIAPAVALFAFAAAASPAWFERHVDLPALSPPAPSSTLTALRIGAAVAGLALAGCALLAGRRATPGGVARVAAALALSLGASELALRALHGLLPVPETRTEARLGAPDPRTGWAFAPGRTLDLPFRRSGRVVRYSIDAHGDRAPSADWKEDPASPTLVVAGESIASGHALQWSETFAARLGEMLRVQVVDVAVAGYGSDQAHLRALDALARFARPTAVVTTVLPVQLSRNLRDDRPHLVLQGGALVEAPASESRSRLRQLFANDIPYLSETALQRSLALTRAILHATAAAARARGARPLFVVPSFGPPRPLEAHREAFVVRALLDDLPHVVVDIDPRHALPADDHPDAEGARQIAIATAEALARAR